jgi:predicted phosphodiesterase
MKEPITLLAQPVKSLLIIPDVHGRKFWRSAVTSGQYDKVIFLGDYVDPYPSEHISQLDALHELQDIIDYHDQNADKVILLLGNHDMHYLSHYYRDICACDRFDEEHSACLHTLFSRADLFKLAHEEVVNSRRYLFTHAGVTRSWLRRNKQLIGSLDSNHLNGLLHSDACIEALAHVGVARYGDYPSGSLLWADCDEFVQSKPLSDVYQVFGHSQQFDGRPVITPHYACLDCRTHFVLKTLGN